MSDFTLSPAAKPVSLPPIAEPFRLPFYCGALHSLGIDYLIDPEPAAAILGRSHPRLATANFDGQACVSLNYMQFFAQYEDSSNITEEIEINIIAYPRGDEHRIAPLSYAEYASGADQSKLLGIARIHVLCDNEVAMEAGAKLFAEPKEPARFEVTMPSLNGSTSAPWHIRVLDAALGEDGLIGAGGELLFSIEADLEGLAGVPVNNTPITGYGTDYEGRLRSSRLSVYHPFQYHVLNSDSAKRVAVRVADSSSVASRDLVALLDDIVPIGVWTYQSAPVLAHDRPFYVP